MPIASRLRRHAPCGCGSGLSGALCCQAWEDALQRLAARLAAFAARPAYAAARQDAAALLDAAAPAGRLRPTARWLEWLLQDATAERGQGPLLGEFADEAEGLPWREEQLLLALLLSALRPHEVTERGEARGSLLRDVLSGAEAPMGESALPRAAIRSDVVICRVIPFGATRRPGLSVLRLPAAGREELLAYLHTAYRITRPGRHVALEDFLDGSAHLYHHFFDTRGREMGGEAHDTVEVAPYAASGLRYAVRHPARVRAALEREPALERQPESPRDGAWLARVDRDRGVVRGRIGLFPAAVEVWADTERGLEEVARFVETALRGLLALPPERLADPEGRAEPRPREAGPRGRAFLRGILARWPETPSAWLAGQVPREAARTAAGRREVVDALRSLERELARQKRLGRAWADVAPVREALDIPPPDSVTGTPPGR